MLWVGCQVEAWRPSRSPCLLLLLHWGHFGILYLHLFVRGLLLASLMWLLFFVMRVGLCAVAVLIWLSVPGILLLVALWLRVYLYGLLAHVPVSPTEKVVRHRGEDDGQQQADEEAAEVAERLPE